MAAKPAKINTMNQFQKLIKYLSILFAGLLAACILISIVGGIIFIGTVFSNEKKQISENKQQPEFSQSFNDISSMDITNFGGILELIPGDEFLVEGTQLSSDFECYSKNGKLIIDNDDSDFPFFSFLKEKESRLTVYFPKHFIADELIIVNEVGFVNLQNIQAGKFYLETDAGTLSGNSVFAENAKIECGVGNSFFTNSDFRNLELETGLGTFDLQGNITGKSEISCGIGNIDLSLSGQRKDYWISVEQGIGSVYIDNERYQENQQNIDASHLLSIDGGIGDVSIEFGK